jgi:hypothetical protein
MRLINTGDLRIQEFSEEPENLRYAVLSHRWCGSEISLQLYNSIPKASDYGPGMAKIVSFCELAKRLRYEWVWIDTCCIDKTSSADLSESINSMWTIYLNAIECFVYLADCPSRLYDPALGYETLRNSVWFSRGWTLQELLAPPHVTFVDASWRRIGSKLELALQLSRITGIPARYLTGKEPLKNASIAM